MIHPAVRKSRDTRSPWRIVGNSSELFRDVAAPYGVVAWELIETTINADVLDGQLGNGVTDVEHFTSVRLEDLAGIYIGSRVRACIDGLLEE